jgi:endothelin-converting enzyme/putative endopeptidase
LAILGRAKIAYLAYEKSLQGKSRPADVDGFTPEQQFFVAWGQFRGDEIGPEAQRLMVQSDPHPIAQYRVNRTAIESAEIGEGVQLQTRRPTVRAAEKRGEVW